MPACGNERKITLVTQVDDVLSGRVEKASRLTSRKQLITVRPKDGVQCLDSHGGRLAANHKKHNVCAAYLCFLCLCTGLFTYACVLTPSFPKLRLLLEYRNGGS